MGQINYVTVSIGVALIAYRVFTAIQRTRNPSFFKKLEPMKKMWGEKAGYVVHVIGYTVVQIVFGFLFVYLGILGRSLF